MSHLNGSRVMDLANQQAGLLGLPLLVERREIRRMPTSNGLTKRDVAVFTLKMADPDNEDRLLVTTLTKHSLLALVAGMQLAVDGATDLLYWREDSDVCA